MKVLRTLKDGDFLIKNWNFFVFLFSLEEFFDDTLLKVLRKSSLSNDLPLKQCRDPLIHL
ncbi:hypothetical protein MTBBW1_850038 [Desulfamplus magnetovallimortis]|uniref:Uncharacterized protein n=1 Tax=Desulfamplus magnetovallimortis TaxID=1246637 RepID=A0A1W1HKR4_9BACT|nr:hypothetical protein MTBBW1_850038 [Desulfamplus magnetovallimortis]